MGNVWQSFMVVNSTTVADPTIRIPDFDILRGQWSQLNHFLDRPGRPIAVAGARNGGLSGNELDVLVMKFRYTSDQI